ncbi:hypothetical protein EMCRGX_G033427 [Ephydatia muelleri]
MVYDSRPILWRRKKLQISCRLFNFDESNFLLARKKGNVLGPVNYKSLQTSKENDKEGLTVLMGYSAAGKMAPPMIIYAYKQHISHDIAEAVEAVDPTWAIEQHPKACLGIWYADGHKSHLSLEVAEFCTSKGILLVALYPNSTHLLQPLDVSVFKSLKNLLPADIVQTVKTIMTVATDYFKELLKVRPIQGPLLLDRSCSSTSRYINGIRYGDNFCYQKSSCSGFTIPADHLRPCRVCNGGQCTISSSDPKSPGVPNADYILPIAGLINFCPGEVRKNKIEYMIDVAKHEIIHALGFSKWSLPFYRDQNGRPRTKRDPVTKEPLNVNGQYDLSGARARIHFNCPTLPGLELENGGGSGSELSHWEARLLGNELMTGSRANSARLSAITLALLQDTGWYQVDFSKAEPLQWGKNAGCQFLLGSCGGYIKNKLASGGSTEPFCTTITDYSQPLKLGCTPDRDAVGFCNMVKQSLKIPPDYQVEQCDK